MKGRVRPDWVDYNGHMNLAYYVLAFDHATDLLIEQVGLDSAHRDATGGTTFVLEAHVTYRREMLEGEEYRIETRVLERDAKRFVLWHDMYKTDGALAASNELLLAYVDLGTRRTAALPDAAAAGLDRLTRPMPDLKRTVALRPRAAAGR